MKKQLLCGAAVTAFAVMGSETSFAAPSGVFDWSGFYIGGHIGMGQTTFKGTWFGDSGFTDFKHRPSGFLGGAQFGQLWQQNTFVYGWEADASFMNWRKHILFSGGLAESGDFLSNKLSMLSSLRARLGMAFDQGFIFNRALLYVTGGVAHAQGTTTMFDGSGPATVKADFSKFGGVVGFGIEWAQSHNWTWRVEGLYYIFDSSKTLVGPVDSALVKLQDAAVVRIGLNYKFGP